VRLLLDTHALLWFLEGDAAMLAGPARAAIADPGNEVLVSVVSLWEVAVKLRAGKLEAELAEIVEGTARAGFATLGITPAHLLGLGRLPRIEDHRDPFDHLLIAQAITEGAGFVTQDRNAARYSVRLLRCHGGPPAHPAGVG
jgi:PIN domain nuclease of toxin-antitoxin system